MSTPSRGSARSRAPHTLIIAAAALLLVAGGVVVTEVRATEPRPDLRALAEQEALVRAQPDNAVAFNDLGNLLELNDRPADAETAYLRAITLDPHNTSARFNLALLLMQRSAFKKAEEQLEAVIAADPKHAWAHYELGVLVARRGERGRAIDLYARAFALDPTLSFAEVNPQIIDNRLMTSALLTAQRYFETPIVKVPRQYGDPVRIAALLLGVDPPAQGASFGDVVEGARQLSANDLATADREADAGVAETADTEAPPIAGALLVEEDAPGRDERVLTSDDLESGNRTGETIGGAAPTSQRGPGSVFNRYRPPTTRTQPTTRAVPPSTGGSVIVAPIPPGAQGQGVDRQGEEENQRNQQRFQPSRRSSAQLDLVLEREEIAG